MLEDDDYDWAPGRRRRTAFRRRVERDLGRQRRAPEAVGAERWPTTRVAQEHWNRTMVFGGTPATAMAWLEHGRGDGRPRDVLPAIRVPTLVLHRADDRIVPRRARPLPRRAHPGRALRRAARAPTTSGGSRATTSSTRSRSSSPARRRHLEPDRVLATVLFTDIVGLDRRAPPSSATGAGATCSTRTTGSSARGSTATAAARSRRSATASSPPSTARRARSAARRDLRDAVRALGLEVRAGLHTGECELTGDDIGGIAVHIGARVGAQAGAERGARLPDGQGPGRRLGPRLRRPRRARRSRACPAPGGSTPWDQPPDDPRHRPGHHRHDLPRLRRRRRRSSAAPTASSPSTSRGPGWVEHDADEIWDVTRAVARRGARRGGHRRPASSPAIGITNQRETVVRLGPRHRRAARTARSSGRTAAPPRAATSCARPATSRSCASAPASCSTPTSRPPRSSGCCATSTGSRACRDGARVRHDRLLALCKLTGGAHATDYVERLPHAAVRHRAAALGPRAAASCSACPRACCPRSGRERRVSARRADALSAARRADRGHRRRPAGGAVRPGLLHAGHRQEHLRHRLLRAHEHRRECPSRPTGCSTTVAWGSAAARRLRARGARSS